MKIRLVKKHEGPHGKTWVKGTKVVVTNDYGRHLIDKKIAVQVLTANHTPPVEEEEETQEKK